MKKKEQELKAHERRAKKLIDKLSKAQSGGRLTREERMATIGKVLNEMARKNKSSVKKGQNQGQKMGR